MKIRFTRHAEEKLVVLKRHGVNISRTRVLKVIRNPDRLDSESRKPLMIAQGSLDVRRVLRVVYRVEDDMMVVITFYPGRKSQYER